MEREEAEEFAKQNGMLYVETSAKEATNVHTVRLRISFFFLC